MTTSTASPSLEALLTEAGARFEGDREAPLHFGDAHAEYRVLRDGLGVGLRAERARLVLRGEDRAQFLHGLTTCDIKGLATGSGAYGYFTNAKGKVMADLVAKAGEDELLVSTPAELASDLVEHLRRYVIMDRVEVEASGGVGFVVAGPRAWEALAGSGLVTAEAKEASWRHGTGEIAGSPIGWWNEGRLGVPGCGIWAAATGAPAVWEALRALSGARAVGTRAFETVRIESGTPRFRLDFGSGDLPQEVGEPGAVSFSKGCYLGQEVVARIHYRGGVQRRLSGLRWEGETIPAPGTEVSAEGRVIGALGSGALSPRFGAIGLAILHQRGGEAGSTVTLAGIGQAAVVPLPFET